MSRSRSAILAAALGLLTPLGLVVGASSAAAATCGDPVWDFNDDGHTDAIVGGIPGSKVLYSEASGDLANSELGLAFPGAIMEDEVYPESFASISLYESAGDEAFCSLAVVGVPNATVDGVTNAGAVYVFRVVPGGDQQYPDDDLLFTITQANDGLDQTQPTTNAHFGATVAANDQTSLSDGPTPLAIGAPGETVDGVTNAGSVAVLNLTKTGDVSSARRVTRAPGKGVTKSSALGTSLSASRGLVVAGAPGRTVSGKAAAGSALLIPTDPAVPVAEVTQSTAGVQGTVETGDRLGRSVAATWNAALGRHEIGIGIPGENVGSVSDAGQVTSLRSTGSANLSNVTSFTQDTAGVHGSVETGDQFGHAIATLPQGAKASAWLVGVPLENIGSTVNSGQIQTVGESKNRAWDATVAFDDGPLTEEFRFGAEVVGPRGDRGPIWLADFQFDDPYVGLNLPGWGPISDISTDGEFQGPFGTAIGG
ncbi:hypothetical protein [Aeromicrobium sp.]|uniref:hypothetical protein n=1 Tax=Aeromicrobium sp. TaxID=1871063 RepID=UPI0030BAF3D2